MDPKAELLLQLELVPLRMYRFRLAIATTEEREWVQAPLTREGERMGSTIHAADDGRLFVRW